MECGKDQIAYIYSPELIQESNKMEKVKGRAELFNSLINAYGLFRHMKIVKPLKASEKDLTTFHSQYYIDHLKKYSDIKDASIDDECSEELGLGYDCPVFENMFDYASVIAGSSLSAAQLISSGSFKYVINWFGGWHHAHRESAAGFCYVNDIVLCILKLRQTFGRVLYIDLDLHHGDGVQEAFEYVNKVVTLSVHKLAHGFFPGTGALQEIGKGVGKSYKINMPFKSGLDDNMLFEAFSKVFQRVCEVFRPEAIVAQCGADSLFGDPIDPLEPFNLTVDGYKKCVKLITASNIPTIFLGGGGYNLANTARLWCSLTAQILNKELNNDIPEHDQFLHYAPDYELATTPGQIRNSNTAEYVDSLVQAIFKNLDGIQAI